MSNTNLWGAMDAVGDTLHGIYTDLVEAVGQPQSAKHALVTATRMHLIVRGISDDPRLLDLTGECAAAAGRALWPGDGLQVEFGIDVARVIVTAHDAAARIAELAEGA